MFNFTFTTPISVVISLAALAGVTLYDTKIDKLTTALAGNPAVVSSAEGGVKKTIFSDPHTHVERVSLKSMQSTPRLTPRTDAKKHLMQKNVPRGGHGFDGYALPLA